jgi:hypothetical protein
MGRPISVARPTASSTAARPAILRTRTVRPERAKPMPASTSSVTMTSAIKRGSFPGVKKADGLRTGHAVSVLGKREKSDRGHQHGAERSAKRSGRLALDHFHVRARHSHGTAVHQGHVQHAGLAAAAKHRGLLWQSLHRAEQAEVRVANDANGRADL